MLRWLTNSIVGAVLSPFVKLGGKYLDNQKDKERLKHGTERVLINADAAVRKIKLGTLLGSIPLFIAESSVALYYAAIMIDSLWPSDYLNPLRLPEWFEPHFQTGVVSIFGVTAVRFVANKFGK